MENSRTPDVPLLFFSRGLRLFGYGAVSIILMLYLLEVGLSEKEVGLLFSLTLLGDTVISLGLTTRADRWGRKRTLLLGAALMILAGVIFALTQNYVFLVLAAIIGVISPSGNEVGPFLSIEQASLTELITPTQRTRLFAWYNLTGSFATAFGALASGFVIRFLQHDLGWAAVQSYRAVVLGYALLGGLLLIVLSRLSPAVEVHGGKPRVEASRSIRQNWHGLSHSKQFVLKLSSLFSLDAFAGGFVIQSFMAFWFHTKFGVEPALLGSIFFGANILAGVSALLAARVAARIGLINTMVFTHLPSNVLLILVPLMPNLPLAITVLLLRFSISQMDVPTRQSYTMAVVHAEERSAASGITNVARTVGASLAPLFAGPLLAVPALMSVPFFICGGLKIVYDIALYRGFKAIRPPEEQATS
ncbi:MAG: MFS transporter [Bdellovibrionales bacterium GWB1_55_8]|nr:MAG: MFS transporter [Bdellovibrionales bacterium GWB1_55_8]